jgi:hypothetical protein
VESDWDGEDDLMDAITTLFTSLQNCTDMSIDGIRRIPHAILINGIVIQAISDMEIAA